MNFNDALGAYGASLIALFALGLVAGVILIRLAQMFQRGWNTRKHTDSGNMFFMLFGAVAIAGVIGVSTMTTMKGPTSALTSSNRTATAATQLYAASRLVADAHQQTPDCDDDGILEPLPWRDPGSIAAPVGGGLLPQESGASKRDPFGSEIGYCVWDHGRRSVADNVSACGGAAANRLEGHDSKTEYVIAVISPGPDRAFQTTCNAWRDEDEDGTLDAPLIVTTAGADDIVRTETITALFAESSSQLEQLPDEACNASSIGTMRYDAGTVQICRETGWQEVGSAIAASGNFIPKLDADPSTEHTSNTLTFSGFHGTRTASVNNGGILVINGAEKGTSAEVAAGDTIAIKGSAAATPATVANYTLYLSTLSRSYAITTRDALPPELTISPPSYAAMDVAGPGSPAYGSPVRFTVTNEGEAPTAVLSVATLSNTGNFEFVIGGGYIGDNCQAKTLAAGATCAIDVRPKAATEGPYSGSLTVSEGSTSANATLSGYASGWTCTVAAGTTWQVDDYTCEVASPLAIVSGATALAEDTDGETTGSATYTCSSGASSVQPGATCEDSCTWKARTAPNYTWASVTYGNGVYVAVGAEGKVMTSADGITWTERISGTTGHWQRVTYGGGLFVAVGSGKAMTSPDGITWTLRTVPSGNWYSVAYGNGIYVAVALTGSDPVITSPDGITWTPRPAPGTSWKSLTYGGGRFVAVGQSNPAVMTSPDGITWTARTGAAASWNSLAYGSGQFVAVTSVGLTRLMTSADGVTWTIRTVPIYTNAVTYGNGQFVAVGDSTLMTSPDGIAWTAIPAPSGSWNGVVFGGGKFVAVEYSATNVVMTAACGGAASDTIPDAFSFVDVTDGPLATEVVSNSITISGINTPVSVWATGDRSPKVRMNGGPWVTYASIENGQTLEVGITTTWDENATYDITVNIGSASDQWQITTGADTSGPVAINSCEPLAAGVDHSCALSANGKAYCSGDNLRGQLGDNSTTARLTPVLAQNGAGPGTYTQLTARSQHTCGLGTNGKAYCWGNNIHRQLGDNTTTQRSTPVMVLSGAGPGTYTQLTAGSGHICGLATDGKAYCWGNNSDGQLGDNSTTKRAAPVLVQNGDGPGTYSQLMAGTNHICGLATDGKAYCWGSNSSGQLGDNSTTKRLTPVLVQNGDGPGTYAQLDGGSSHTCGLATNGRAYCWGNNTYGQLGDNSTTNRLTPVLVQNGDGLGKFTQLAVGGSHTCGVGTDAKTYCWGLNTGSRLGVNSTDTKCLIPLLVQNGAGPGTYTQLMASENQSTCGVGTDGKLYCWGVNADGQLGDGTTTNQSTPVLVQNGASPGTYATCTSSGGGGEDPPEDACETGPVGTACSDGAIYAGESGGYRLYAWHSDETGTYKWKTANTVTNTGSFSDGVSNTDIMIAAGAAAHPAANVCRQRGPDWYLAATDELIAIYANRVAVGGFKTGSNSYYWTSLHHTTTASNMIGFGSVPNPGVRVFDTKTAAHSVRCIRR